MARAANLLTLVPCREHPWEVGDDGRVCVLVPRYGAHALGRWLARNFGARPISVRLDRLGSAVWRACDGEASVDAIAARLEAELGPKEAPGHDRLARFFAEMDRGRLIRWRKT